MDTAGALRALWVAIAVQLLGRALDLRWHVTHDEFEGTSQQFEAHWLLWIGVLATIAVAIAALRSRANPAGRRGYATVLAFGAFYVPVSVWHFVEHANEADPEVAHVLLAIGQVGMVAGAVLATVLARRRLRPASGP